MRVSKDPGHTLPPKDLKTLPSKKRPQPKCSPGPGRRPRGPAEWGRQGGTVRPTDVHSEVKSTHEAPQEELLFRASPAMAQQAEAECNGYFFFGPKKQFSFQELSACKNCSLSKQSNHIWIKTVSHRKDIGVISVRILKPKLL